MPTNVRKMNDSRRITSRSIIEYAIAIATAALLTSCIQVPTYTRIVFTTAFTTTKPPIYHPAQHIMHPKHSDRINPARTRLPALPQYSLSDAGRCNTRSQRSIQSEKSSQQRQGNFVSRQKRQQKGSPSFSSTVLQNTAIPIVASSAVAFVSAISAGIFSGGLHAIAGTYFA
jgi:hypothetical protein